MRILSCLVFILLPAVTLCQSGAKLPVNQLYIDGLNGDVQKILSVLDTASNLDPDDLLFKEKYEKRFKLVSDTYEVTDDSAVQGIVNIYTAYWRSVLLRTMDLKKADALLKSSLIRFLKSEYPGSDHRDFQASLKSYLNRRGFYSNVGRTGGFYDLFLWKNEVEQTYWVGLPGQEIDVRVVFIEEVKTMGWEDYATFGRYYPAGWAKSDRLYCVKKAYDIQSEKFLVSYLGHEAQHFADYKSYPKLGQTDLEYRAKLTELILSKTTTQELIKVFIERSKNDLLNPHGYVNFKVVSQLSTAIWGGDFVSDLQEWSALPATKIKDSARKLLLEHSGRLKEAGSTSVTGILQ